MRFLVGAGDHKAIAGCVVSDVERDDAAARYQRMLSFPVRR